MLLDVHARVLRLLARRGLFEADADDPLADDAPALSACYEGRRHAAHGPRSHARSPRHEARHVARAAPRLRVRARRKRRKSALLEFRDAEAKRREVDVQVILPGHCVADIVDLPRVDLDSLRTIPGFGACRLERYGALLEQRCSARWA